MHAVRIVWHRRPAQDYHHLVKPVPEGISWSTALWIMAGPSALVRLVRIGLRSVFHAARITWDVHGVRWPIRLQYARENLREKTKFRATFRVHTAV